MRLHQGTSQVFSDYNRVTSMVLKNVTIGLGAFIIDLLI